MLKVLDFGIAKLADAEMGTIDATRTRLTAEHSVVGTFGYMSPEQAQGRALDGRSDIFSLGALLYQMLAGRRAFDADSGAGLLSALLRDDPPPLRSLAPTVPASIDRIVSRCLQKDPARRFQSVTDVMHALEDSRDDLASASVASAVRATPPATSREPSRLRAALAYLAAGAALGAGLLIAAGVTRSDAPAVPRYQPLITEADSPRWPAWSPDARALAYTALVNGVRQLFVRGLDAVQPAQVTNGPTPVDSAPTWSSDGSSLYFVLGNDLYRVGVAGGEPRLVARDAPGDQDVNTTTVTPDGRSLVFTRGGLGNVTIWTLDTRSGATAALDRAPLPHRLRQVHAVAFSPDGKTLGVMTSEGAGSVPRGIWLVPWPTGTPRHVLRSAPYPVIAGTFSWLPDSRRIVFTASPADESASRLFLGDTISNTFRQLTAGIGEETDPGVSPDGTRIAFRSLHAGLDLVELPIDGGAPIPLVHSSRTETYPDMSAAGVLAYVTDAEGRPAIRVRSGSASWSRTLGEGSAPGRVVADQIQENRLSPDGQRVAAGVLGAEHAIWIYPVGGGAPARLDPASGDQHGASWSPDGNWIAYRRLADQKWQLARAPLGGGAVVRIADADAGGVGTAGATDWSPTGEWVAYEHGQRLCLVSPDDSHPRLLDGPRPVSFRFSRDGTKVFAVRHGVGGRWELATYDVASGRETRVVALPLASSATVQGLALTPDESRLILGTGTPTSDIWLLEQFEPEPFFLKRWLRRQ